MMKRMTRAAAALLAAALLLCLAGCQKSEVVTGSAGSEPASSAPEPQPTAEPEPTAEPQPTEAPQAAVPEEGLAILGEWSEDHVYTNEVFGLQYTLPENWVYASQEEILAMSQITLESGLLTDREAAALGSAQTLFIMMAQAPLTGSNVLMLAENMAGLPGASMMDEELYAQLSAASLTQSERGEVQIEVGETSWVKIDSMDFLALPIQMTYGDLTVQQMTYIRRVGDRMLSIGITSMDGTSVDEMPGGIKAFSAL